MKNLIKYLAVLIVAIVISATVYVKTSSNNNSVKVQNQKALATMAIDIYLPCLQHITTDCEVVFHVSGGTISAQIPGYYQMY